METKEFKNRTWTQWLDRLIDTEAFPAGVHRVLLYGASGTGKSGYGWHKSNGTAERITLDPDLQKDELLGMVNPATDGTLKWSNSTAVRAMLRGGMLILDEIDECSPECLSVLHGILDDTSMARIQLPFEKVVKPADGFCVIATTNQQPDTLRPAILDRFDIILHADTPSDGVLKGMDEAYRAMAKNSVENLDNACKNWSPQPTPRRMRAWKQLQECKGWSEIEACHAIFGQHADDVFTTLQSRRTSC